MKKLLIAAMFLVAAPITAQGVVDTITVDVYGEPTAIQVVGPLRGYVGDVLTYTFEIVDSDGNPTIGLAIWDVVDPSRATIVAETDSTISVSLLRPGRLTLQVTVLRLTALRIGALWLPGQGDRTGTFRWIDDGLGALEATGDPTNPRPALQLCAVGYSGQSPIFTTHRICSDNLDPDFGILSALRYVMRGDIPVVPLSAIKNVYPTGIPEQIRVG